jgi:hypothetical protein
VGAYEQLARADVFVYYDDVQYDRGGWRNRNRIKTASGVRWLTVPVHLPGGHPCRLDRVEVAADPRWVRRHVRTLEQAYARAPYRNEVLAIVRRCLGMGHRRLVDLNIALWEALATYARITTLCVKASKLGIEGTCTGRLVSICQYLGATRYLTGPAARAYLDEAEFRSAGIEVEWHNFRPRPYPQLHGEFVSHLSFVDLLMNCGSAALSWLEA